MPNNSASPPPCSPSQLLCVQLYVAMLSSLPLSCGAKASRWVRLVVVREINCGRVVNYSSWGLKGLEHILTPVRHTFIRSQSVPMGSLSVRADRPQLANINDMDHKKRLFCVQWGWTEEEGYKKRGKGGGGRRAEEFCGEYHRAITC